MDLPKRTTVHLMPIRYAAAAESEMNQVERIFTEVPGTLIVARYSEAHVGIDSKVMFSKVKVVYERSRLTVGAVYSQGRFPISTLWIRRCLIHA